jgi:hypothetical protein
MNFPSGAFLLRVYTFFLSRPRDSTKSFLHHRRFWGPFHCEIRDRALWAFFGAAKVYPEFSWLAK